MSVHRLVRAACCGAATVLFLIAMAYLSGCGSSEVGSAPSGKEATRQILAEDAKEKGRVPTKYGAAKSIKGRVLGGDER